MFISSIFNIYFCVFYNLHNISTIVRVYNLNKHTFTKVAQLFFFFF